MRKKPIEFEVWLRKNYPERIDSPKYECNICEGDGFMDSDDGYYMDHCSSCNGTGSKMFNDYKNQNDIDKNRLSKFLKLTNQQV